MPGMDEILVGTDGSAHGRAAIAWAVAEARSRSCGVLVVHVSRAAPNLWATTRSVRRELRDLAQPIVDHALAYAASLDPDVPARGRVLLGNPHRALVGISATTVLTVVGRRGQGTLAAHLVGSLSQTLIAHSPSPVVVVAADADPAAQQVGRVVVALGDRPASLRPLEFAIEQARRHAVELCVLHAWQVPALPPGHRPSEDAESVAVQAVLIAAETQRLSAALAASGLETTGVRVRPVVLAASSPLQALREFCDPSDLLILGQHRHGRYTPVTLGPVISGALHQLRCTVATVGHAVPAADSQVVLASHPADERPLVSGVIAY